MPLLILSLTIQNKVQKKIAACPKTPNDMFGNLWGGKGKLILWKVKTSQAFSHSPNIYGRHITQHILSLHFSGAF
jgi:hypothetical protein